MIQKSASILFVVCLVWLLAFSLAQEGWYAIDYQSYFRPAALSVDPYSVPGFYNPPWVAWLLWPFAVLPSLAGQGLHFAIALTVIVAVLQQKMKIPILGSLLVCTSYPVVYTLAYGNLEWLALLGLLLPRPVGMILLMVKPQLGLGIAAWWLWDAWQKERFNGLTKLLVPITWLTLIVSWAYAWRPWMMLRAMADPRDAAIWPWGLALVPLVLHDRKNQYTLGQLASPHLTRGSWIGLMLSLAKKPWLLATASAVSWGIGLFCG